VRGGPVGDRALILRQIRLGEGSKIVSALTAEHGRVKLVARGARRLTSRLAGLLEPGNELLVQIYARPDRDLWTLADAGLVRAALTGATSLDKLSYLLAVLELGDRLLGEREALPEIEDLYRRYMDRWHREGPQAMAALFFALEAGLLRELGLGLSLDRCGGCGAGLGGDVPALYRPSEGDLLCASCAAGGGGPSVGRWIEGEDLRLWQKVEETLEGSRRCELDETRRRLFGRLLHDHMTHHLPRYRVPRALYWLAGGVGEQGA
jgi:DNA repair protein RecO (recombination protein O)